jgi:hypothetical protein
MARELEHRSIEELEQLFTAQGHDEAFRFQLLEELSFRATPAARALRGRAMSDMGARHAPAPALAPARSADVRMRPPGTPNLPPPRSRSLSTTLKLDFDPERGVVGRYIRGVRALIAELRESRNRWRYELKQGTRLSSAGNLVFYSFELAEPDGLFDDASVRVELNGATHEGTIAAVREDSIVVALQAELGETVPRAQLSIDSTELLEKLAKQLEGITDTSPDFRKPLADAVVGSATMPPVVTPVAYSDPQVPLNESQARARRRVLEQSITFIWGPPGCGKTYTLGEIVRTAFEANLRVLICSNTNKAVDQLLYRVCRTIGEDHLALKQGYIVRLGRIADDKLEKEFASLVSVDEIAARRSAELQAFRIDLIADVAGARGDLDRAEAVYRQFSELDRLDHRNGFLHQSAETSRRNLAALQSALEAVPMQRQQLAKELSRAQGLLRIFARSEHDILADIQAAESRQTSLRGEIASQHQTLSELHESAVALAAERAALIQALGGASREQARDACDSAKEHLKLKENQLGSIEARLKNVESSVVRESRVLGVTGTTAYIKSGDIGASDLVIIDEASMMLLPVVWFVSGLSKDRVIVCGDFRQIPPIVSTDEQAISDAIGLDVFRAAGLDGLNPNDPRMVMLDTQRRMLPAICDLISGSMYSGQLRTASDESFRKEREARPRPRTPFDGTLTLIDTSALGAFEAANASGSRFNLMHALLVRNVAWHLTQEGFAKSAHDLAIVTPYAAQAKLIRRLLESEELKHVQVGTVHAFQGDERNAVVLEIPESDGGLTGLGQFVRGIPPDDIGARLINVAVSRAQNHLIVIANLARLDELLPSHALLRGILWNIEAKGRVVPAAEVLALGPLERDLQGLEGDVPADGLARRIGLFDRHSFEAALAADIGRAEKSVAIFSGFVTPGRVREMGGLLSRKSAERVKVRCITRPPHANGSMGRAASRDALNLLEQAGCTVDCRVAIHEKVVIIDQRIVWHGSLNALSYAYRTDESMTRLVSDGFAELVAASLCKKRLSEKRALEVLADAENPRCQDCNGRSFFMRDRGGALFRCESGCGWSATLDGARLSGGATAAAADEPPTCGLCGAALAIRTSGAGEKFYGCTRYPKCSFTRNL